MSMRVKGRERGGGSEASVLNLYETLKGKGGGGGGIREE